jgi:endogenous inhibitor of DNA gyrase (YacG/DUF329 family)
MHYATKFCPRCGHTVRAMRESTGHVLHLLMALLTCGLWLIVWGIVGMQNSSTTYGCPICGTPIPAYDPKPRLVALGVVVGAFLIVLVLVSAANKTPNAPAPSRAQLEQASRAEVARRQQEARSAKEEAARVQKNAAASNANPFDTDQGRAMMLGLFIKPVLKQTLKDPDSLQDLSILSVKRLKGKPVTVRVAVSYRARNAFGALVGNSQVFACVENADTSTHALNDWIVLPVRK